MMTGGLGGHLDTNDKNQVSIAYIDFRCGRKLSLERKEPPAEDIGN